jgi:hypothetical protein
MVKTREEPLSRINHVYSASAGEEARSLKGKRHYESRSRRDIAKGQAIYIRNQYVCSKVSPLSVLEF